MAKKQSTKAQKSSSGFQRKYNQIFHEESNVKAKSKQSSDIVRVEKRRKEDKSSEKKPSSTQENSEETLPSVTENSTNKNKPGKKPRFILFVGNLPYTITKEELSEHFKKAGELEEVRLLLNAQKEPKGCAFVEYKSSAAMLNALLYHHTTFQERKINVEMTCGGGGNSAKRKKKLQEKRNKSNELIHKMLAQKKKTKSAIK
ncbi:hypothetical protein ACHWQZ_G010317 [Mnemiopsis leidyi]